MSCLYFTCLDYAPSCWIFFALRWDQAGRELSGLGGISNAGTQTPLSTSTLTLPPTNHPPLHLWWPQHVKPPIVPTSLEVPVIQHVRRWREWGALMIFLRSSAIAIFPNIIFMMLSFRLLLWRGLPDISGHRHWWTFPALIDQWLIQLLCHKVLSVHKMDKI